MIKSVLESQTVLRHVTVTRDISLRSTAKLVKVIKYKVQSVLGIEFKLFGICS